MSWYPLASLEIIHCSFAPPRPGQSKRVIRAPERFALDQNPGSKFKGVHILTANSDNHLILDDYFYIRYNMNIMQEMFPF
jgi:hypothetical protein